VNLRRRELVDPVSRNGNHYLADARADVVANTSEAFMSSRRRLLLIAHVLTAATIVCLMARNGTAAGELVLVLHAGNKENPDSSETRHFFLGETAFWPGNVPVKLFVRPGDSPAADAFFRTIGIAPTRFKRLWQEKQLSGQGSSPETVAAAAALISKVATDPGAIGFALSDELPSNPPGVRVVPLH
jgi:hypothetical protein